MDKKYSQWLKHVFDHEFDDWYFELDAPNFELNPLEAAEFVSMAFDNSVRDLDGYSR